MVYQHILCGIKKKYVKLIFMKKTQKTINFIKEWLELCQIPEFIIKNTSYHQCVQAILNILLDKYGFDGLIITIKIFNLLENVIRIYR